MVAVRHWDDFKLTWDGSKFYARWLKKWFSSLIIAPWIRGTVWGEMIYWAETMVPLGRLLRYHWLLGW